MNEETWKAIINELHKHFGHYSFRTRKKCGHRSATTLPDRLLTDDLLAALEEMVNPNT